MTSIGRNAADSLDWKVRPYLSRELVGHITLIDSHEHTTRMDEEPRRVALSHDEEDSRMMASDVGDQVLSPPG